MRWLRAERIPLALAAAFIAVCSIVTAWNLTVAAAFPRLAIRNWNLLYGLIEEAPAPFSVASFVRGEDQTNFSRRLGATLPIYAPAVPSGIKSNIPFSACPTRLRLSLAATSTSTSAPTSMNIADAAAGRRLRRLPIGQTRSETFRIMQSRTARHSYI